MINTLAGKWRGSKMAIGAGRLSGVARETGWFLSRHLMTIIAGLVAIGVLLFVPQVHHVLFHLPPTISVADWPNVLLWFGLVALALFVMINLADCIVQRKAKQNNNPTARPKKILPKRWTMAGVLLGLALLLTLIPDPSHASHLSPLAHWLRVHGAIAMIAIAAGMAPGHLQYPSILHSDKHPKIFVFMRLTCSLLILFLLGEFFWFLARSGFTSYQPYTVWAVFQLLFIFIMLGRAIDALYRQGWLWIRLVPLGLAVVVALLLGPSSVGRRADDSPPLQQGRDEQITTKWFSALNEKIASLPKTGPLVFVAASGGGSRAALFTALVLESLEEVTFPIPTLDEHDRPGASMADRIVLISAVSGGSLASAYFASAERPLEYTWRHSSERDLQRLVKNHAIQKAGSATDPAEDQGPAAEVSEQLRRLGGMEHPIPKELLRSQFVDHMSMNFMAPILRRCLFLRASRGRALCTFWESQFGWEPHNNQHGIRRQTEKGRVPPVLLLNGTLVEDGKRVTVGIPALPPSLLQGSECPVRSLSSIDENYVLSLAEAVRISANFPWGIPVARLRTSSGEVHVLDGGILDNSGIDVLYEVLASIKRFATVDTTNEPLTEQTTLRKQARTLWTTLTKRGLLIIEIDSGAKPSRLGKVAGSFRELLNPIQALNKSTFVRLAASRQIYLDQIDKLFESELSAQGDRSAGSSIVAPRRPPLTYLCNDDENVMTAWALGPDDKAKVFLRALVEQEVNKRELLAFAKEYEEQYALAGDLQQSYEYLVRETAGVTFAGNLVIGGRGPIGNERMKQAYFQAALPEVKPPNELKNAELARVVSAMKQMRYQEQKEKTEVGRKARARIYKQRNP